MTTENLGRVVGFSAYEIAVQEGFIGTEAEWLESLNGTNGTNGSSILSGAGVPSVGLGVNGYTYLNTTNGDLYLKVGGVWGSPTGNIKGIQGIQGFSILSGAGAPTTQGVNGDSYLNTTNGDLYLKASGSWGSPTGNIKGVKGDKPVINTTSITSNIIATGTKTFTLVTPVDLVIGQVAKAYSLADPTNYVLGYITNISPTSIEINVSEIGGTGTKADWIIALGAFKGTTGITTPNIASGKMAGRTTAGIGAVEALDPVGLTLQSGNAFNGVEQGTGSTKIVQVAFPTGGMYKGLASETGAIKICNPSFVTTQAMTVIKGSIYLLDGSSTNRTCQFIISFYPSLMGTGCSAVFLGANALKFTVRWFTDGTTPYITIADLSQTWNYLAVTINLVEVSYNGGTLPSASTGWQISLITAFTGTQAAILTETLPRPRLTYPAEEFVAASGSDIALLNSMSPLQMFQNLDKSRDNRYTKAQSDVRYLPSTLYLTSNGVLITTSIQSANSAMIQLELFIQDYTNAKSPTKILLTAYNNNASNLFSTVMSTSLGEINPTIDIFISGGYVCFWMPPLGSATIHSTCYINGDKLGNFITSITNATRPTGTTRDVSRTAIRTLLNNGSASNLYLGDGTTKPLSDFALKVDGAMYRVNNAIAGGVDLNTLIATGFYVQQSNGSATLVLNYPATRAGFLIVYANTSNYIFQNYIDYATGETWTRSNGGGGSWSAWKKTVVLGADGKIDKTLLPAIAITDTFPVASQAAMLALTAEVGDVAIRSDISKTFILRVEPATTLGNWSELLNPTDAVTSVAGKTGVVTLVKADVGLSNVDNTADTAKPVSTAQQTALDLKAPIREDIVTVSANKTFALTDENKFQDVTANASITVPANGTIALPIGAEIEGVVRDTFTATFIQDTGVTIINKSGLAIAGFTAFTLKKVGTNTWLLTTNASSAGVTTIKTSTTLSSTDAISNKYKDITITGAAVGDLVEMVEKYFVASSQVYMLNAMVTAPNTVRIYITRFLGQSFTEGETLLIYTALPAISYPQTVNLVVFK